jgi:hypothetical protein
MECFLAKVLPTHSSAIQLVPDEMDMLQHEVVVAFRHEMFSQSFMSFGNFYYYYLLEKI